MVAPLHYGIVKDEDTGRPFAPAKNTTLTLQVGDYFRATELLVQSINNISFSKEVIAPRTHNRKSAGDLYDNTIPVEYEGIAGFPLYAKCSITFIPAQMMTKERFESYFKDMPANKTASDSVFNTISSAFNNFKLP